MNNKSLANLTDEELRQAFRKHTLQGLVVSVLLLVIFLIIYFTPMETQPAMFNSIIITIAVISVALAIWYHLGRRRYYKEFRRRNMRIRG